MIIKFIKCSSIGELEKEINNFCEAHTAVLKDVMTVKRFTSKNNRDSETVYYYWYIAQLEVYGEKIKE